MKFERFSRFPQEQCDRLLTKLASAKFAVELLESGIALEIQWRRPTMYEISTIGNQQFSMSNNIRFGFRQGRDFPCKIK